uniref:Uncharacterized protein n=1 Tax=Globisporangium ultimum (strain ATCC 200006 / CBS 805.95 / DAOM BR144) TaxID=431595 RepID=K3WLT0_GLOUD
MVLFITEIQNRPTRKTGRKQQQLAGSSQSAPAPYCARAIGYSVLAAYVNAIMDMWRLQYSMQCNPQFPSRPSTVKELLKRKKTQSHQESEAAFDDIGAGTMVDFVHSDQTIQQIVDCMFGEKTESGLKHRADMLLCLGFSSRGDNIRKLRLPNIGLISFADEGVCGAKLLRILGVQSSVKTQLGRKQASTAENKGVSASSVDRQDHWATKSRVGAYAKHSIPFDCDLDQNQADIIYHVLC